MRNQFTQMVDAGVAPFKHEPVAQDVPTQDLLVRTYNAYWGAATDTHMSLTPENEYIITGHLLQDPQKWTSLCFSCTWGGIDWRQSGYNSLIEFFGSIKMTPMTITRNGEMCMKLVSDESIPAANIKVKEAYTTNSRIPINVKILERMYGALENILSTSGSVNEVAKSMNESTLINGENWMVYENKIVGDYAGQRYIIETSSSNGVKVKHDEELQKLLDAEKLGDLYLVQYKGYMKVASDKKEWSTLLNKNKYNSIQVCDYNDFTAPEWLDRIKYVLATIN